MNNKMKLRLVKLTSLGLSVAMAAAPVTVLAEGESPDSVPASAIAPATNLQNAEGPMVGPGATNNYAVSESIKAAADKVIDRDEKPAEGSIEEDLVNAQGDLDNLAKEVERAELAKNVANRENTAAMGKYENAVSQATDAGMAADIALENPTDEILEGAAYQIGVAKDYLQEARDQDEKADVALEGAWNEFDQLLIRNGLAEYVQAVDDDGNPILNEDGDPVLELKRTVTEEQIVELRKQVLEKGTDAPLLDELGLKGEAKEAIADAATALDKAFAAKAKVDSLDEITVDDVDDVSQDDLGLKIASTTEQDSLGKFLFEYQLRKSLGDDYVKGSVAYSSDVDEDGFALVTYKKVVDEEEVVVKAKVKAVPATEEGQQFSIQIKTLTKEAVEATPDTYKNAEGVEFDPEDEKYTEDYEKIQDDNGIYMINKKESLGVGMDQNATEKNLVKNHDFDKPEGVTVYEAAKASVPQYTVDENAKTETYKKKEDAKKEIKKLLNNNKSVRIDCKGETFYINPGDKGWEKTIDQLSSNGGNKPVDVTVVTKTTVEVDAVREIVTKTYTAIRNETKVDGRETSKNYFTGTEKEVKEAAEKRKQELEKEGWKVSKPKPIPIDKKSDLYYYEIEYTKDVKSGETVTIVVSNKLYVGDSYTKEAGTQGSAAEYNDNSAIDLGDQGIQDAGTKYQGISGNAGKLDDLKLIAGNIIQAVQNIFRLSRAGVPVDRDTYLDAVDSAIGAAENTYQQAIDKKAELDRQNQQNQNQNQTTGEETGEETGGETGGTTTAVFGDIPTISSIANPVVTIAGEQTPLAGPTRRTTRRVAANVEAAEETEEVVEEAEPAETVEPTEEKEDEVATVGIEDEATALAGGEKSSPAAWLWALILALLAAAGFTTYKVTKTKKEN